METAASIIPSTISPRHCLIPCVSFQAPLPLTPFPPLSLLSPAMSKCEASRKHLRATTPTEDNVVLKLIQSHGLKSDPRLMHTYSQSLNSEVSASHGPFITPLRYLQLLVLRCYLTSLVHYTPYPTPLGRRPAPARLQHSCRVSALQEMLEGPTRIGERVLNSPRSCGQSGLN